MLGIHIEAEMDNSDSGIGIGIGIDPLSSLMESEPESNRLLNFKLESELESIDSGRVESNSLIEVTYKSGSLVEI